MNRLGEIDNEIIKALKIFDIPGAAVGVIVDGQILLAKGYGYRNLKTLQPMTENTLLGIGSCTKAFTTFLLGQLIDEKIINWDDPVIRYIPEFRLWDEYTTQHTTIKDLLTHQTGIARHDLLTFNLSLSRKDLIDRLQYLEHLYNLREKFHYSNLMYAVAGYLIEKITGKEWEKNIKERIFEPLEMNNSYSVSEECHPSSDLSENYYYLVHEHLLQQDSPHKTTFMAPAYGINSSVCDMLKWIRLQLSDGILFERKFIEAQTLQEMHFPQIIVQDASLTTDLTHYGLGWRIGSYRGNNLVMHGGTRDGFQSQVSLLPSKKIGIVILTNCRIMDQHGFNQEKYFITCITNSILDKLLECEKVDWLNKLTQNYAQHKLSISKENEQKKKAEIPSFNLQEYIGFYNHAGYGTMQIELRGKNLIVTYGDITSPLLFQSKDHFIGTNHVFSQMGFAFRRNSSNEINELHVPLEPSVKPITFLRK